MNFELIIFLLITIKKLETLSIENKLVCSLLNYRQTQFVCVMSRNFHGGLCSI